MKYLIIIAFLLVSSVSYADVYIVMDKNTGEVRGTVDVTPESVGEWSKDYTMKLVGEEYRGSFGYELNVKDGKVSKKSKQEIDEYKALREEARKEAQKAEALEVLGLTGSSLQKIKAL